MDDLTGPPSQTWTPWACGSNGLHHATTESFGKDLNLFWGVFFCSNLDFFLPTIEAVAFESTPHINTYIVYIYTYPSVDSC